jgi:hypothetical protein
VTTEQEEREIQFALSNITGKGFGGDYGFKTTKELAEETGGMVSEERAREILLDLEYRQECLRSLDGDSWSIYPAQCVICNDDPCTCGIGTWR